MRIEGSVTSVSWIPMQAIEGALRLPFEIGLAHYDEPPGDTLDLATLLSDNGMRFANDLRAWIEVEDGKIAAFGQCGRGYLGVTKVGFGALSVAIAAVAFPDLRSEEARETSVRFVQTCGGQTGAPMPNYMTDAPFVRLQAPLAWTTLALTLHADGRVEHEIVATSPFPRHWIYDERGQLAKKSGLIDFTTWFNQAPEPDDFAEGKNPFQVPIRAVESALERELSALVVDAQPQWRELPVGETLVRQGEQSDEVFLLFDGILEVEMDNQKIAEVAPGAILGEMSGLSNGKRTATLRALTPCRVAVVAHSHLDSQKLQQLAQARKL